MLVVDEWECWKPPCAENTEEKKLHVDATKIRHAKSVAKTTLPKRGNRRIQRKYLGDIGQDLYSIMLAQKNTKNGQLGLSTLREPG